MLNRRQAGIGIGTGIALAALATPLVVTGIERFQARHTAGLLPQQGQVLRASLATVLYFSRSGNTALLARHLAQRLQASLYPLQSPDYALGLRGWANALRDAQKHTAQIALPVIDLPPHDTLYLASPIWMFSPAPPLWQFIASHRLDGKHIVLVNTFNSRFKTGFIEQFRQRVLQQGARSFAHQFVRRGRMGSQLSPQDMLNTFDNHWHP